MNEKLLTYRDIVVKHWYEIRPSRDFFYYDNAARAWFCVINPGRHEVVGSSALSKERAYERARAKCPENVTAPPFGEIFTYNALREKHARTVRF